MDEEVSGQSRRARHVPQRTCCGCREHAPRSALVRLVGIAQSGTTLVVVDGRARLPGRGAWLHPDQHCLDLALRRRALPRALRVPAADVALDAARLQSELEQVVEARTAGPDGPASESGQSLVGSGS